MHRHEFATAWERQFGGLLPVVNRLREPLASRWFTDSSPLKTPSSSLSEPEQALVLHVQNPVLTTILGPGQVYHLVRTTIIWKDLTPPHLREDDLALVISLDPAVWTANEQPGRCLWHFWSKSYRWEPGSQDRLLILAAEDREANLMFIRKDFDGFVSPHSRGLDICAPDPATRDRWRRKLKRR